MRTNQLLRLTIVLLCLACLPSTACAQEYRDVVFLKNGSVIKGFYKELYPSDSLRMETIDGGVLVCAFSDIERIAKERRKTICWRTVTGTRDGMLGLSNMGVTSMRLTRES